MKFTIAVFYVLYATTLSFMQGLAPGRDHSELASAIAWRAFVEEPLFRDDRRRTVALLVAVAFRESSLRNDVEGDFDAEGKATSFGSFQIHLPGGVLTREGWSGADLKRDPEKSVAVGYRMLKDSIRACRDLEHDEEKLSAYARGSCRSEEGKRLSRDRFAKAKEISVAEKN